MERETIFIEVDTSVSWHVSETIFPSQLWTITRGKYMEQVNISKK